MPAKIENNETSGLRTIECWESKTHTPSWLRPGQAQGFMQLKLTSHIRNKYLTVDLLETATRPGNRDIVSSKRTMATLSVEDSRTAYNWLREVHEETYEFDVPDDLLRFFDEAGKRGLSVKLVTRSGPPQDYPTVHVTGPIDRIEPFVGEYYQPDYTAADLAAHRVAR